MSPPAAAGESRTTVAKRASLDYCPPWKCGQAREGSQRRGAWKTTGEPWPHLRHALPSVALQLPRLWQWREACSYILPTSQLFQGPRSFLFANDSSTVWGGARALHWESQARPQSYLCRLCPEWPQA